MDTSLSSFIHGKKLFSLSLLINAFSRLTMIQLNKGCITFEDVVESVKVVSPKSSVDVWNSHIALIFEGAVTSTILNSSNPVAVLKIPPHLFANEGSYLRKLLDVLYSHSQGGISHTVEHFQAEALEYCKNVTQAQTNDSYAMEERVIPHQQKTRNIANSNGRNLGNPNQSQPTFRAVSKGYQTSAENSDVERSDAIMRLLAQVRKNGMDILFPQLTHDMVSSSGPSVIFNYLFVFFFSLKLNRFSPRPLSPFKWPKFQFIERLLILLLQLKIPIYFQDLKMCRKRKFVEY